MFRIIITFVSLIRFSLSVYFCGSTIFDNQFIIQNNYGVEICEFLFQNRGCVKYNLNFILFNLQESRGCQNERLEIGNRRICGIQTGIKSFESKNGGMKIRFVLNQTLNRKFQIFIKKLPCDSHCCADSYTGRKFLISSPNFPYSTAPNNCVFRIVKSNQNICRLRMHFKFFSVGFFNNGMCHNGYVVVDNKILCGCQSGVNLIADFLEDDTKVIMYRNDLAGTQNFNGFVMEVIQDECPGKYTPEVQNRFGEPEDTSRKNIPSIEKNNSGDNVPERHNPGGYNNTSNNNTRSINIGNTSRSDSLENSTLNIPRTDGITTPRIFISSSIPRNDISGSSMTLNNTTPRIEISKNTPKMEMSKTPKIGISSGSIGSTKIGSSELDIPEFYYLNDQLSGGNNTNNFTEIFRDSSNNRGDVLEELKSLLNLVSNETVKNLLNISDSDEEFKSLSNNSGVNERFLNNSDNIPKNISKRSVPDDISRDFLNNLNEKFEGLKNDQYLDEKSKNLLNFSDLEENLRYLLNFFEGDEKSKHSLKSLDLDYSSLISKDRSEKFKTFLNSLRKESKGIFKNLVEENILDTTSPDKKLKRLSRSASPEEASKHLIDYFIPDEELKHFSDSKIDEPRINFNNQEEESKYLLDFTRPDRESKRFLTSDGPEEESKYLFDYSGSGEELKYIINFSSSGEDSKNFPDEERKYISDYSGSTEILTDSDEESKHVIKRSVPEINQTGEESISDLNEKISSKLNLDGTKSERKLNISTENEIKILDRMINHKDKESTNYLNTEDYFFPNYYHEYDYKCHNFNWNDLKEITDSFLWKTMPKCQNTNTQIKENKKCCIINFDKGYVTSPGYPFYYNTNLNICYRFLKTSNACGYKVYMSDFNIEPSYGCRKDSFEIYKNRYCGGSLFNSHFYIDLNRKDYEDVFFKSDHYGCGRGFYMIFQQVECERKITTTPQSISTTTLKSITSTTYRPCGGEISRINFSVNFSKTTTDCTYIIRRSNEDVCWIRLYFINFELECNNGYLLINDRQYCGQLYTKNVTADFDPTDVITIVYHYDLNSPVFSGIALEGRQVTEDCYRDPPAQLKTILE